MSEVFLSYRQTDDAQLKRVREFGERLRGAGINVVLDQFFDDDNPGGPSEGWPQWSSNRASKTYYVLIVGTESWFQCFDGTQQPGEGLGAACEARVIRQRIYDAGGMNENIRIVLLDDTKPASIPIELRGYKHFQEDGDFEKIVRWLGGKLIIDTPRTSIPHNLPSLQPFFGREEELKKIAEALDPESRTWGALIDGPGGMGKTSLAVRAAYDASIEHFEKIVFVSLKSRELDDDGERDLSNFLISGLAELLNELARELGHADITKATEDRRPHMLLSALRGTRTLLVLDNLESLTKRDRDIIFTFVKRLPAGCKAILTSRGRIGSGAEELILEKLSERAALATLAKLAENNPTLAKTRKPERVALYRETGGNPLLLRWTAGQIGRGSCVTLTDAIAYLRSCPEGNDPLEFVFGDLVEDFSEPETRVLCALTYFTLSTKVEHITELAECDPADAEHALRSLINRSLVVPSDELKTFTLVPLVAYFLRKKRPAVVEETGNRLEKTAFALTLENGFDKYDRFFVLDAAWPTLAAALPRFLAGPNDRLQMLCSGLDEFLNFTGRWDELLTLSQDAENRALAAKDFRSAGWRAYSGAAVFFGREQAEELLDSAGRAEEWWRRAQAGKHEQAFAIRLRGVAHQLAQNYVAAIAAFQMVVDLWRTSDPADGGVAMALNDVACIRQLGGDLDGAERDFREALQIAKAVDYREGIAYITGNLAKLLLQRQDWSGGEELAHEALALSETIGRQELIASDCMLLSLILMRQDKNTEAIPFAERAVEIFTRLGSPEVEIVSEILAKCESYDKR